MLFARDECTGFYQIIRKSKALLFYTLILPTMSEHPNWVCLEIRQHRYVVYISPKSWPHLNNNQSKQRFCMTRKKRINASQMAEYVYEIRTSDETCFIGFSVEIK